MKNIFPQIVDSRLCLRGIATIFALAILICTGCERQSAAAPVAVEPLYAFLAEYNSLSASEKAEFVATDSHALNAMTGFLGLGEANDSVLSAWSASPAVKVFTPAVDSVFPSLRPLEGTVGGMYARFEPNGLARPEGTVAAVVWGNAKAIVLADSCVLIALNHFLGADFPGYSGWPAHVRESKTPQALPYSLCEALVASAHPYVSDKTSTVLSRLLYEGAIVEARSRLVPDSTPRQALGCTETQLKWFEEHSAQLWQALVATNLLYSSDSAAADRLTVPAPSTPLLHPESPGRAGRFIGWLIVKHCMERQKLTLAEVLSPDFYNNPSVLIESRFSL